ncbi:RNA-binding domain-containing protein [Nitratireductor aquimarinus]|uniref:RNA-binding domain-containing protein n=1 Tax=Nitratireductor aquimarinus TaxID=889300 RepID=UPI00398EFC4D
MLVPNEQDSSESEMGRNRTGLIAEQQLHTYVKDLCLDKNVLEFLLPDNKPHEYETVLWDYKRNLPNTSGRADGSAHVESACEIAELVKDVVAFHNSYGGYILAGIDHFAESPIIGCNNLNAKGFTVEKLNEQVFSYTRTRIECRFARHSVNTPAGVAELGLLVIPMRSASSPVVKLHRGAPEVGKKPSFKKHAVYARIGDSCTPLKDDPSLIQFLCSTREFNGTTRNIEHNLPPRDPNVIKFVGRGDYLLKLWEWLIDRHTSVKTLTALGGTGKTAIAHEFCDQFLQSPPSWVEKLIWLSAKQRSFSAILGKYENITRTDFSTSIDFLEALARECGCLDEEVEQAEQDQSELLDLVFDALQTFPSLVVVDDIDTLPAEEQNNLFSLIQQLAGRLHDTGSRFLFTSRLDLGADTQRIPVQGFDEKEFTEYAKMVGETRDIVLEPHLIKRLHTASKGSPIFCSSIIRLASLGMSLPDAIKRWKEKEGEEVRRFAFERELKELTESQARALFALCSLSETTYLELKQVLEADEQILTQDLARLREFHLYASAGDPRTGAKLQVPEPILLMRDILEKRLQDPKRLEKECARLRSKSPRVNDQISLAIRSVLALWKEDDYEAAEITARTAVKSNRKSGDLHCLLGKCQLKLNPPRYNDAERSFSEAFLLKSRRVELVPGWLEAKKALYDWRGIVDLVEKLSPDEVRSQIVHDYVCALAELGRQAVGRDDLLRAVDRYKHAMLAASHAIGQNRAGDKLAELRELCRVSARNYVALVDRQSTRPRDRLDVFNAVSDAFKCHITETSIVTMGMEALDAWASVAFPIKNNKREPERILERTLVRLSEMSFHIQTDVAQRPILAEQMKRTHSRLSTLLAS